MAWKPTTDEQREKARERQRRWAAKNPDYDRNRYVNDPERRAANVESMRRWRLEHPEEHAAYQREYSEKNRESVRERSRTWREENLEHARAYDRMRARAKQAKRRGQFVEHVERLVVLERADNACGICGDDVDPLRFHVDHIIPLAHGGEHSYANVQVTHPKCNLSKGARIGR